MSQGDLKWKINPLKGLGPLTLGASPTDVAQLLDTFRSVVSKRVMFDGSTSEFRGLGFPVCSYENEKLRGVDTDYRVDQVLLNDIDVYKSDPRDVIHELNKLNGGMKFGLGIILFDKISISTTGFYEPKRGFYNELIDDDRDERTLGVYRTNAFDHIMHEFRDVRFPAR